MMTRPPQNTSSRILLGVDGGGSNTVAVVAAMESGNALPREVARAYSGPGNLLSNPAAMKNVLQAVSSACANAREKLGAQYRLDSACLSLAGAARDSVRKRWEAWAGRNTIAAAVRFTDDVEPVLQLAGQNGPALAVIAGTGSIVTGRDVNGKRVRCGGWGPGISDEGSGHSISIEALRCAALHEDNRSSFPAIHAAVLEHFGQTEFSEVVPQIQQRSRKEIASFAKRIISMDECNDAEAREILLNAGRQLARLALDVANQLSLESQTVPLAAAGGIVCNSRTVQDTLIAELSRESRTTFSLLVVEDPVEGAVLLAANGCTGKGE